jgi:formate dehydrogenase alpha subunit
MLAEIFMLTLTINDTSIQTPPGSTVLEAALQNGIDIPTLCHYPGLRSVGACRLCVVDIDGMRGQPTACTTPAAQDMVVRTDTSEIRELRREVLSLILSEHPYTCLVCARHDHCSEWQVTIRKAGVTTGCENCPKNGQCELQNLVDRIGLSVMPYTISYRGFPVEKDDPFFDRDYNLCILCGRCVRTCQEVRRTGTLAFVSRGPDTVVSTAFGQSHLLTNCEFCGSCVDVCPTGALYDKRTKWEGVPEKTATTVCPYCSVGCQLDLWIKNRKIIGVRPSKEGAVNGGQACTRGRFGIVEMVHAPDRLRTPMIRKNGRLAEATWEQAFQVLAEKLPAYKGDAFALLASAHLTSEAAYILQKFARQGMNTRNVDSPTALPRHAHTSELAGLLSAKTLTPIRSIREAGCILAVGTNPRLSHPVIGLLIRQAQAAGAKLIVVDPRCTELARRADVWLKVEPGKDAELIYKLGDRGKGISVERLGSGKQETTPPPLSPSPNVEHIWRGGAASAPPPDAVSHLGEGREGAEEKAVGEAAKLLAESGPMVILYGSGVTHYESAPQTIQAIEELSASLSPKAGVLPLLGAANTFGILETGFAACDSNRNYTAIAAGITSGEVKALYLAGEMPPLDDLASLELLVVQDTFLSLNVADFAHVVLPAASFAEISGTYTNLEGRPQKFAAAIPPAGESRPDWWIVSQLAQAMGLEGFNFENAAEVWEQAGAHGRYRSPVGAPVQQVAGDQGSMNGDQQSTIRNPQFAISNPQLILIVERNQFSYRGSALTDRVRGMAQVKSDEDAVTLHPTDAARLEIAEGDMARLASAHGSDTFITHLSADVPPGMAFASINPVHGSKLFPGMLPEVKAYPVQVEKV